jgi:RNA polymerase sigma-70 factor (ECF subfamily)
MADFERFSDRDLIARFRDGDREAFTALYRTHSPAVFRLALHLAGDREKATEVTQDVFVWLIHHAGDFEPARGELGSYLAGVARKFVLRLQQSQRRWMPLEESAATLHDPAGGLEAAEVRKAIASLPMRYREAVVLCDLEGQTYQEAAGALGCATGTVRSRLHRARELLGRKLQRRKESQRCAI